MEIAPTAEAPATDKVVDAIAVIEQQRQAMEKESGLAPACGSALRQLHELLDHEKEALRMGDLDAGSPESVDAVKVEIGRVEGLTLVTNRGPVHHNADLAGLRQESRRKSWQNAQRSPAQNKGRRTMGRGGGR